MRLIDYVILKNKLSEWLGDQKILDSISHAVNLIDDISDTCNVDSTVSLNLKEKRRFYKQLATNIKQQTELDDILEWIDIQINKLSQPYFEESYKHLFAANAQGIIENRQNLKYSDSIEKLVEARCGLYTSFQYPAIEFCPKLGKFTKYLVAADPLYLVDIYQEFLDASKSQFPSLYQQRLRTYLVKSDQNLLSNVDLSTLPENQFAFIFSWDAFNYIPLSDIKDILKDFYKLLKPGGVVMFTYNNCDLPAGVEMVDYKHMSYVPYSLLKPMCESIGYEEIAHFDPERYVSWIELKKPGTLSTVKVHQALMHTVEI